MLARPITPQSPPAGLSGAATPDPEIMDISEHHYQPRQTNRAPPPQGMPPGFDPSMMFGGGGGAPGQGQQGPGADDPMMAMLQQMMAGGGAAGGAGGGLPPGLADMFAGGVPGAEGSQQPAPSSSAYLWRILHFVVATGLALYTITNTTFTGSKRSRDLSSFSHNAPSSLDKNFGQQLFFWFATAEVVLQSSRFFIERGQLTQPGMLGTLSNMLPQPWGGYVRTVGRYSIIYTTVVADAMVVVFVLGVMAWWRNGAGLDTAVSI